MDPNDMVTNPGKQKITFANSYLSIILLAVIFLLLLVLGALNVVFFSGPNLLNVFRQFAMIGTMGFAVTLSIRAKGPDLSIPSVMALSSIIIAQTFSNSGSLFVSIIIAVFIAMIIGCINGALTVFARIPAIFSTLITGIVIHFVCYQLTGRQPIYVQDNTIKTFATATVSGIPLGALALVIVSFLAVFLLILFTKLGVPTYQRTKKPTTIGFLAYIISACLAAIAGFFMLSRVGAAFPNISSGYGLYILFVFGCIASTRLIDNRYAPALYAFAPPLVWVFFINIMNLTGVASYWQIIANVMITLPFLIIAFINWYGQYKKSRSPRIS